MFDLLALCAFAYLLGSIPSAALVAKWRGREIFTVGSGNMGAMNTARNLNRSLGALVLALDVGKGSLAAFAGVRLADYLGRADAFALVFPVAAGLCAVLGHCFSIFVGFKGGKGLATTLGIALPVYPLAGLYGLVLLASLYLISRRAALASVLTILLYPLLVQLTLDRLGWPREESFVVLTGLLAVAAVVLLKHLMARRVPADAP